MTAKGGHSAVEVTTPECHTNREIHPATWMNASKRRIKWAGLDLDWGLSYPNESCPKQSVKGRVPERSSQVLMTSAVANGSMSGLRMMMPTELHSSGIANASSRHDEQTEHGKRGAARLHICTGISAGVASAMLIQNLSARISRGSWLIGKTDCVAVALWRSSRAIAESTSSVWNILVTPQVGWMS